MKIAFQPLGAALILTALVVDGAAGVAAGQYDLNGQPVDRTKRSEIRAAEHAVYRRPDAAAARVRLGQAYLAAGRLMSAEQAFDDALRLDPAQPSAALGLALARIALGKRASALQVLAGVAPRLAPPDLGLALALAGAYPEAIQILELSARDPAAGATVRQNLAFAYAMAGRWRDAQTMAGRDLAGAMLDRRIMDWARLSQPRGSADQVAAMVGFHPAQDPGLPAKLALAPRASPDPPAEARVMVQKEEAAALLPMVIEDQSVTLPEPVSSPVRIFGKYVVQLGAYYSQPRLQQAWSASFAWLDALSGYIPSASNAYLPGRRPLYRLGVGRFASSEEAATLCIRLRKRGIACYVRLAGNEAALPGDRA